MQGLEGGRGPPADFGRNRTRREETSNGTFDRRAGDIYNERGYTYDRTQLSSLLCVQLYHSSPHVSSDHAQNQRGDHGPPLALAWLD